MPTLVLLPNQLFKDIPISYKIILIEHPKIFHKNQLQLRIAYHRATMKAYYDSLPNKKKYIECSKFNLSDLPKNITMYDPMDKEILTQFQNKFKLTILESPLFLCTTNDLTEFQSEYKSAYHHQFYIWCRKKKNILMDGNKPMGDKWSFDTSNRKPFDKSILLFLEKENPVISKSKYKTEAEKYTETIFNKKMTQEIYLPITREETSVHLDKFIEQKLKYFGKYEDASNTNIVFGFHSILSPMINIGLITIPDIILRIIPYFKDYPESVEGFIRQLFWREYVRLKYITDEEPNQNVFKHTRKLDKSWYDGTTPFEPINIIIRRTIQYGYCHHIERLMFIGNLMFLLETDPKEVYDWFMNNFLDSYEWVMIPNIYGMSQYANMNVMKRPYFSSSNYLFKMSNLKKSDKFPLIDGYKWYEVWDALYYNFIGNNLDILSKNYSTANAVSLYKKKDPKEIKKKISILFKNWKKNEF